MPLQNGRRTWQTTDGHRHAAKAPLGGGESWYKLEARFSAFLSSEDAPHRVSHARGPSQHTESPRAIDTDNAELTDTMIQRRTVADAPDSLAGWFAVLS